MKVLKSLALVVFVLWLLLSFLTGSLVGGELLYYLGLGWVYFVGRVAPKVHIRWDLAGSAVVYAVVLVVGAHLFLRWVYREMGRPAETEGESGGRAWRWRWRWTVSGFVIAIMMFAAGTAAIGIMHQVAWLATSPRPMYSAERPNRVKCAWNLRQIGQGLDLYAKDHGGKYPDDFGVLLKKGELGASLFVCRSADDEIAAGETNEEKAANLLKPGRCSYIYLGKGLTAPVKPDRVVALEPPENHGTDGMNVLYGDGHVEFVGKPDMEKLLVKLGLERVEAKGKATTHPQ